MNDYLYLLFFLLIILWLELSGMIDEHFLPEVLVT